MVEYDGGSVAFEAVRDGVCDVEELVGRDNRVGLVMAEGRWESAIVAEEHEARSLDAGLPDRDPDRDNRPSLRSFNRFVRSSCSNCSRRSLAQTSSN